MSRIRRQLELLNQHLNWQDIFGGTHLRCPHPERHVEGDKHPSAFVYPDGIYCFGCGWRTNNIIDACRIYRGWTPRETRQRLYGLLARQPPRRRKETANAPFSLKLVDEWVERRSDTDTAYLMDRYAVSERVLDITRIGYAGRAFTIPHFGLDGRVWAVKFRRDDRKGQDGPKYWSLSGRPFQFLYPGFLVQYFVSQSPPKRVMVCEGEFDALAALSQGIPALSLPAGTATSLRRWEAVWGAFARNSVVVYLAFDMDDAGLAARQAAFSYLESAFPTLLVISAEWEGAKDVAEFLRQGGKLL